MYSIYNKKPVMRSRTRGNYLIQRHLLYVWGTRRVHHHVVLSVNDTVIVRVQQLVMGRLIRVKER
jgi:hypothetical protein